MKTSIIVSSTAIAVIAGCAALLQGSELSDALRAAPPAVQAAVVQLTGGNPVKEFDEETDAGKKVYDLEYTVKGTTYAADIDPSGKILTREVMVDTLILPPAVTDAAKKAHADGTISEAAIVSQDGKVFYELESKVGSDVHEIQISADGKMLADTIEAPEAPTTKPAAKSGNTEEKD